MLDRSSSKSAKKRPRDERDRTRRAEGAEGYDSRGNAGGHRLPDHNSRGRRLERSKKDLNSR